MLIYIFLFSLFSIFCFLDICNIKAKFKISLICSAAFIIVFLSAIRWENGTDWGAYYDFFTYNHTISNFLNDIAHPFEPGYAVINYLIKTLWNEYSFLLFIEAIIIVTLKYLTMVKYAIFPFTTILLNFAASNADLFPVRQSIAISICIFSIKYIINRKKINFFCSVLFASTFHITALFFLLAYKIYYLKISRKTLVLMLCLSFVVGMTAEFKNILFENLQVFLGKFLGNDLLAAKLLEYEQIQASGENFGNAYSTKIVGCLSLARRFMFAPVLIYFLHRFQKVDSNFRGMLNLTWFGYITFCIFVTLSTSIAGRLSIYYFIFEIFSIPFILLLFRGWKSKAILLIVIYLYCGIKYAYGINGYYDAFIPFHTIFD